MKTSYKTILIALAALSLAACRQPAADTPFALESDKLETGPEGGSYSLEVSSPGAWTASANVPWITVSPANGRGSAKCTIAVDTTLLYAASAPSREGVVRIQRSGESNENREITVVQSSYGYVLALSEPEVTIPEFAALDRRYFDVQVSSNVDFRVRISYEGEEDGWLSNDSYSVSLSRGARPRSSSVRFRWEVNPIPEGRNATIEFVPVDSEGNEIADNGSNFTRLDRLSLMQSPAEAVEANTRRGDSTALVAIARAMDVWASWDPSERMDLWSDVELWEDTGDPDLDGRVRYARFFLFNTDDGIPYQVQYLTAAEELVFYSNENAFLRRDIDLGSYITKLSQLKRLTIAAYGIDSLSDGFTNLSNLEYLNLSGNNFDGVPEILTPENFPRLHALSLTNNQRYMVYDISNVSVAEADFAQQYAGLYRENYREENQVGDAAKMDGMPLRLLRWSRLDTLELSLNYIQGELPSNQDLIDKGWSEFYTEQEIFAVDTLYSGLAGTPKVLPNAKRLAINLNRLSGELPAWVLYHPNLNLWDPFTLVFTQEGRDRDGTTAAFTNLPLNLDYYYALDGYRNKTTRPNNGNTEE